MNKVMNNFKNLGNSIVIQSVNDTDKGVAIISYLQWNFKKNVVNFPCYTSPAIQDEFRKKILESCKQDSSDQEDQDTEFIKILAPLTNNPNPKDEKILTNLTKASLLVSDGKRCLS